MMLFSFQNCISPTRYRTDCEAGAKAAAEPARARKRAAIFILAVSHLQFCELRQRMTNIAIRVLQLVAREKFRFPFWSDSFE